MFDFETMRATRPGCGAWTHRAVEQESRLLLNGAENGHEDRFLRINRL